MHPHLEHVILLGLALLALAAFTPAWGRPDTWGSPLAEKERAIEQNIRERHNILGLYPSQVEVLPDGTVDTSTQGNANVAHSVCWTANYLAGASYRYAFLKREGAPEEETADAKTRADELFEAVYRCQLVTGVRGLQSRGYVLGHGASYEEREDADTRNEWHQGAGEYSNLRWRGSPSHHNYSDSIHGLGAYYDLAAEGEQRERCREAIDALVGYWVDNDLVIQPLDPDAPPVPILGFTDGRSPTLRVLMAVAGAKVAHHATGHRKYRECYDRLVKQFSLRGRTEFRTGEGPRQGHDDAEHMFGHLDNLFRIEEDPELLAFYRVVADALWENHRDDAQSLFTYTYLHINADAPDREKALGDALRSLRTWPTDTTLWPVMNSLRDDIEQVDGKAKEPLPLNEAAWDNEYIWKGNLYQLDGWLARPITSVAAAPDDPAVLFACDLAGDIYRSLDGGERWACCSASLPAPARALAAPSRVRILLAATDDGLYLTTTGCQSWRRCELPAGSGTPTDITVDPLNANVVYLVCSGGVYRSVDFGEEWLGARWEELSGGLPPAHSITYGVGVSENSPARVYAIVDDTVYSRQRDQAVWAKGGNLSAGEHVARYPWIVTDPQDSDTAYAAFRTDYGGMGMRTLLTRTDDGGLTWTYDLKALYRLYAEGRLLEVLMAMVEGEIGRPVVDAHNPRVLYVPSSKGVLRSKDQGASWELMAEGLDIPYTTHLSAPPAADTLFAGTYAGLYRSDDGAETFEDANLRCQFRENLRREIGGAAYIDAYWMGRYYGFIDDETATSEP